MAANLIQTNFTAGEISPRMRGRVDVARYQNAAEELLNVIPVVQGPAIRRPGTRFSESTKDSEKQSILIPFVFSKDQAYSLEFGHHYMRVRLVDGSLVELDGDPYEVVTPYTEDMLFALDYCQGADTMFIAHPDVPLHRLQRFAHDDWRLMPAPFMVMPFDELGTRANIALTLSNATAGAGRTMTAASAFFLAGDIGRDIWFGRGIATITAVASDTSATVTVVEDFATTALAANQWVLKGSPQASCTPTAKDPVGGGVVLKLGLSSTVEAPKIITGLSWISTPGRAEVTVVGHGYSTGNTIIIDGNAPAEFNGTHSITVVDANTFRFLLSSDPGSATALGTASRVVAGATDGFRSSDAGSYVKINGGLVQITQVDSPSQATGIIRAAMTSIIAAQANAWILQSSIWNTIDGYPSTVTLRDQRLYAGGSPGYPQTVCASRIGDVLNFELWTNDDDAFMFTLDSNQVNPVAYLDSVRALLALTYGGEFTIAGGTEKPISPTNVSAKDQSTYGCARVKPVRVGNELLFVQRAGRKLRALSYQLADDGYSAPDLTVLAEHLAATGFKQMAYQQEPESIIWVVRNDGVLLSVTIDRAQEVVAWARHETAGQVESVAVVPGPDADVVFCIVRREINGAFVRYVERLDPELNTDCAITGEAEEPTASWGGLDWLEGEEVDIVADGVVMPNATVVDGAIDLPRAASRVEIGLHYKSRIVMLPPEAQTQTGSAQARQMRLSEIAVRLLKSVGCTVNDEVVPFRHFGLNQFDQTVEPFTGDKHISMLGWNLGDAKITIEQNQPLPLTVVAVIYKLTTNG